jgi:hypothetical protein
VQEAALAISVKFERLLSSKFLTLETAVQYAKVAGLRVIAVGTQLQSRVFYRDLTDSTDSGADKKKLCLELGADKWIDFNETKDLVGDIKALTDGLGAHSALVTAASVRFCGFPPRPVDSLFWVSELRIQAGHRVPAQRGHINGCRPPRERQPRGIDLLHGIQGTNCSFILQLQLTSVIPD